MLLLFIIVLPQAISQVRHHHMDFIYDFMSNGHEHEIEQRIYMIAAIFNFLYISVLHIIWNAYIYFLFFSVCNHILFFIICRYGFDYWRISYNITHNRKICKWSESINKRIQNRTLLIHYINVDTEMSFGKSMEKLISWCMKYLKYLTCRRNIYKL